MVAPTPPGRPGVPGRPGNPPGRPPGKPSLPSPPAGAPRRPGAPAGGNSSVPAAPAAPAMPSGGSSGAGARYQTFGVLTSDQLLNGTADEYSALTDTILKIKSWVQTHLKEQQRTEEVAEARLDIEKREAMRTELDRILYQYTQRESLPRAHVPYIIAAVSDEILGLGPIEPLWRDERITEVMVNGPDTVYVEIEGRIVKVPAAKFRDRDHLLGVCQQILSPLSRRVDQKSPLADGRLADGSRVNVVHYASAPGGPLLTIRRFPETVWTVKDLIENGSMSEDLGCEIAWLVKNKASVLVSGATGSGKSVALDTPIPTPTGMSTMGELQVGDRVVDENGIPCNVTGKFLQEDPEGFEVVFSDGSVIVADGEHNWYTSTRASRISRSRAQKRLMARNTTPRLSDEEIREVKEWANDFGPDTLLSFGMYVNRFPLHYDYFNNFLKKKGQEYRLPERGYVEGAVRRSVVYSAQETISAWLDHAKLIPNDQREKGTHAEVRTTREILDTLRTSSGHTNHAVQILSRPVEWPEKELRVDPYVMGIWLGDGTSSKGDITTVDKEVEDRIAEYYKVSRKDYKKIVVYGLKKDLRTYGVIADKPVTKYGPSKFIPEDYIYSSVNQRRALIAGLLDSDGTVNTERGVVQFANSNKSLIEGFRKIIHSLGYQSTLTEKIPSYVHKGVRKQGKIAYTVSFHTSDEVFYLPRKKDLHASFADKPRQGDRSELRYIVDVRPLAPENTPEMACITVDSPNHLYLCGDSFIPTHNTSLLNALSSCIPRGDRVVTIEDALELRFHPDAHVVSMEARPPDAAGENEIRIRDLVKNSLRMRPERIVVGEVRDAAALDMLQAMNTGHEGSMTTLHANGPADVIDRLGVMVAQGGEVREDSVQSLLGSAVDIIVFQRRYEDGTRRVEGVYEVPPFDGGTGERLQPVPLIQFQIEGTDENKKFYGKYVRKNEISDYLKTKLRLDHHPMVTMDEVRKMSELPQNMKKN